MNNMNIFDLGSEVRFSPPRTTGLVPAIPVMVYRPQYDPENRQWYLVKDRESFTLPKIIFGDHSRTLNTIASFYDPNARSLGVLAEGLKGTGKSLFCEDLCNQLMAKHQLPVVMIDTPIPPAAFQALIPGVGRAIWYFDEFGKVYPSRERAALLPLFSDSSLQGHVFLVTANSEDELSEYMINRPGRFRFKLRYRTIPRAAVLAMLEHYKIAPALHRALTVYAMQSTTTYDILTKVMEVAACTPTLAELKEQMLILNVPELVAPFIRTVYYQSLPLPYNDPLRQPLMECFSAVKNPNDENEWLVQYPVLDGGNINAKQKVVRIDELLSQADGDASQMFNSVHLPVDVGEDSKLMVVVEYRAMSQPDPTETTSHNKPHLMWPAQQQQQPASEVNQLLKVVDGIIENLSETESAEFCRNAAEIIGALDMGELPTTAAVDSTLEKAKAMGGPIGSIIEQLAYDIAMT